MFTMETSKKGNNSAIRSPTEKKNKYGSASFSCLFHTLNFKTVSLTILDHKQSVTDRLNYRQAKTNMSSQLLRSWGYNQIKIL